MFMYPVDDELALVLPRPAVDAPKLFALIQADQKHIGLYLPWAADLRDVTAEQAFLTMTLQHFGTGQSVNVVIMANGEQAGMISFNGFSAGDLSADIGYWLGEPFRHRGIMTRAVKAMCRLGFEDYGRNKVVIRAAVDNAASNAVAKACGFHHDAVLRQGELLQDGFHDVNEWSLLKSEWLSFL